MFRSRTKIRLLTEDLYRISNMLNARILQKKMMKICIWMYGSFVISGTAFLEVTIFRSGMYFVLLMMILPSAAAANQAAATAREIVLSLPGWFPKRFSIIKLLVCRSFKSETALTLWNIYRIDKSMLISAIGTLISYGILLGTLGSVQSSNDKK
ncbi:hypothetical protein CDAR_216701 [Caerostris darwini]|uniref:Uncharacterized protein n=1 Tax=Caerostris darwini TaxID=1538125 RepID=A0AAV4QD67_9ARAC|nr:hypothetical protein CDAR_216701 [Caerostris darwini]